MALARPQTSDAHEQSYADGIALQLVIDNSYSMRNRDYALGSESISRLDAVKQLLGEYRVLLIWDNFESVREMPDPAGATRPLDEAECARLREFLAWVRDHSASTVIITGVMAVVLGERSSIAE